MRLAGTYHPIPFLLKRLKHYLPSVSIVNALWLDFDKQIYTTNEKKPLNDYLKVKAQNIRAKCHVLKWSQHSDFFERSTTEKKQLSIEDEDAMNVLSLYFTSPIDGQKDVIMITFPSHVFLKNLNTHFKGVTSHEKHILGSILSSVLLADYEKAIREREFLKQVEDIHQKQVLKIKQLTEDLKSTEQLYSSAIRNILNDLKLKLEVNLGKEFIFSKEVAFKLAKERLSIHAIEEAVKNAIYLAYNLNLFKQKIEVTEDYFQLEKLKEEPIHSSSTFVVAHQKVLELLDRYEAAAIQVSEKGWAINGKNMASQLHPPVTPPAITDAVKKNKSKITYLLQQYPDKWSNIRKYIKPISALDERIDNARAVS